MNATVRGESPSMNVTDTSSARGTVCFTSSDTVVITDSMECSPSSICASSRKASEGSRLAQLSDVM